ncbi:MAG: hypothetical protein HY961_01995 [Ignavibacteriae bacterium]|nr:hypothetical protein [Ignavibacteriota bacterium]
MTITLHQVLRLLVLTISGMVASVVVGLLVYGGSVFQPQSVSFAFVSFGLSGAFIFAFYHVRGLSETITAAVVVSAIQFIVGTSWFPLLNALLWSFGVNLPMVGLAFIFEKRLAHFKQAKFIVVGLVYGAMFVLLTLLVAALSGVDLLPARLFRDNFLDGLFIGLGLGLGIEAGEAFLHSIEIHRETRTGVKHA